MSIPLWPTDLPSFVLRSGYSEGVHDPRIFTAMERGPPKTRRGASSGKPVSFQAEVSYNQKARIERFWEEDTSFGLKPFYIPQPSMHEVQISTSDGVLIVSDSGPPLLISAFWLVMFSESSPISFSPGTGVKFIAAINVTVMP